jgi:hypothetical protein
MQSVQQYCMLAYERKYCALAHKNKGRSKRPHLSTRLSELFQVGVNCGAGLEGAVRLTCAAPRDGRSSGARPMGRSEMRDETPQTRQDEPPKRHAHGGCDQHGRQKKRPIRIGAAAVQFGLRRSASSVWTAASISSTMDLS